MSLRETQIPKAWRPKSRRVRKFLATYIRGVTFWGYAFSLAAFAGIGYAFIHQVDLTVATPAGAYGTLEAAFTAAAEDEAVWVVRRLAEPFSEVSAGDPVLEVASAADGPLAAAWQAMVDAGQAPTFERPRVRRVVAPEDGVIRYTAGLGEVAEGAELFRVLDYSRIRLRARLTGEPVAKARVGQVARLSRLEAGMPEGTLMRIEQDGVGWFGESALGTRAKEVLLEQLDGETLKLRNDLPFEVDAVRRVDLDAQVTAQGDGVARAGFWPGEQQLTGKVIEGTHRVVAQLSGLPDAVKQAADVELMRDLLDLPEGPAGGDVTAVEALDYVVQVEAAAPGDLPEGALGTSGLAASAVDRGFEALIELDEAPDYLVALLRSRDRSGGSVKMRAEVVVGTTPAALVLLRR